MPPQDDSAKQASLQAAQTLEKKGLVDGAVQAYQAAGALDDAARVLASARRFVEAANVLFGPLGIAPEQARELLGPARKQALQSAILYARGNEPDYAARLFVALGERERAADTWRRAGDPAKAAAILGNAVRPNAGPPPPSTTRDAAQSLEKSGKLDAALDAYLQLRDPGSAGRVAQALGKFAQSGELYITAGLPLEAAQAFAQAGDRVRCLDALLRVPRDDARYRMAAVNAIRVASELETLDFHIENFLSKFVATAPSDDRETDAFARLARLYRKHDFPENAADAWRKVLTRKPDHAEAQAALASNEAEVKGTPLMYARIVKEDQAFRDASTAPAAPDPTLPPLPPVFGAGGHLPTLPDLPPVAGFTPPRAPVSRTVPPRTVAAEQPWVTAADAEAGTVASVGVNANVLRSPSSQPSLPSPTRPVAPAVPFAPGPTIAPAPPATTPPINPQPATAPPVPAAAAPTPISLVLESGVVLNDRYRLEKKIGQGGMAAVFAAHDLELDETIAIKIFEKQLDDAQMLARFKQELLLSRQLSHPNIIRLYDIGMVHGRRYITMELLRGTDLKGKIRRPLDVPTGLRYLEQACDALQHAHERGVVHRDIKPANLFVTQDDVVKLMDFGIAKRTATPGLTVAGMIAGTPEYMSPEQITGFESVTGSTDLYAVGIMAYEMFTASVPFRHKEIVPLLMMHVNDPPPPPRARNPALPEAVESLILRLLGKLPEDRPTSAGAVVEELRRLRKSV